MTHTGATLGVFKRIRHMTQQRTALFGLGQQVRHRDHAFQGLVMDVDARYAGPSEETGGVSPEQPFYSVLIVEGEKAIIAYAAEEALVSSEIAEPLSRMEESRWFNVDDLGRHAPRKHTLQ